jgi:outer membrane lipoprotein SlyB
MNKMIPWIGIISSLSIGMSACASHRPVLTSNAHLIRVGSDGGERDIDECLERAKVASSERRRTADGNVVAGTAASSAVGAAAGGAGGAVVGRAAQGAAAGAAGGAAASLTSALLQVLFAPKPPDPSFQQFVDRCLREKGYDPAGWK